MISQSIPANQTTPSGSHILRITKIIDDKNPDLQVCSVVETIKFDNHYFGRKKIVILNAFDVFRLQTLGTSIFLLSTEMAKRSENYKGKYQLNQIIKCLENSKFKHFILNSNFKIID